LKEAAIKRALVVFLFCLALPLLAASAAEVPVVAASSVLEPACASAPVAVTLAQPDLGSLLGVPKPYQVTTCNDICISDFKICRDSCHSLACYNQCRSAYDTCAAGC
jgi:hypothetical protein